MRRAGLQKSFRQLTPTLKDSTLLVVPPEDYIDYVRVWGKDSVVSCDVHGIAPTRDWIFKYARLNNWRDIVMLDDDLTFQRLRLDGRITNCEPHEVDDAFAWLEHRLGDGYAHAGFAVRFSDKGGGSGEKSPSRMMHVLGYNLELVPEDVSFGAGATEYETFSMDDFNMTLQLLTRGIVNIVSQEWRTSPSPGNAKGGASTWRNLKTQNQSAHDLKRLFPRHVAIRQKNNWQGMEGGEMYDVTVQWKGAYNGARRP
jgi:hypothetical protein